MYRHLAAGSRGFGGHKGRQFFQLAEIGCGGFFFPGFFKLFAQVTLAVALHFRFVAVFATGFGNGFFVELVMQHQRAFSERQKKQRCANQYGK